jgi:1,4-dihydroxy-2-naphthoate polyprenyltransferase
MPENKVKNWIIASRPKTLLAALVPVMVGSAVAFNEKKLVIIYSIVALICSVLIQIGTNFANDLYDFINGADNERRKGPRRVLASGLISIKVMKFAVFFTFGLAFIFGLYLVYEGGLVILIIGTLSILAGLAYTAGPFPLAYNGLGDIFVFMFFGIVGTAGTYYLHTKELTLVSFVASVPVGALITNILVVNNYRDIEEDKAAGKYTLAVKFGKTFTRYQFISLTIVSFLIPAVLYIFFNYSILIFLPYFTFPAAYKIIVMLYKLDGMELNKTLELAAKLSALFGILFSIGLAL